MRYWLVIPAAGSGQRFGAQHPKQYFEVQGRSLLEWSLSPFLVDPRCQGVVVVIAAGDPWWPKVRVRLSQSVVEAAGGAARADSVRAGLEAVSVRDEGDPWVLVHDAARPCVTGAEINRLIAQVDGHHAGGLLALPLADTLKRAAEGRSAQDLRQEAGEGLSAAGTGVTVQRTEPRAGLWRALTPQMFRLRALLEALQAASRVGREPSDESQAIEWAGLGQPLLVPGAAGNVKVTTAADLTLVAALLGVGAAQ